MLNPLLKPYQLSILSGKTFPIQMFKQKYTMQTEKNLLGLVFMIR